MKSSAKEKARVALRFHPMVWKVLKKEYGYDGMAVDLSGSWIYPMITMALEREEFLSSREERRISAQMQEDYVYVSIYDIRRFGCNIRLSRMAAISTTIYQREREKICHVVAAMTASGLVTRQEAMREILMREDFDEEDLRLDTLKKQYIRNFRHIEEAYCEIYKDLYSEKTHRRLQQFI